MNDCKFTSFGLYVKMELLRSGKNQAWLETEIKRKTGLFVDSSYMYKILTGKRKAPKIIQAIREILGIDNKEGMPNGTNENSGEGA